MVHHPAQALTRAAAVAAAICAFALASCGGGGGERQIDVGPNVGQPINLADCHDWNQANTEQRLGTIHDLEGFAGGPVVGNNANSPSGRGAVITDKQAYDLFEGYCSQSFATGFKLYKLYTSERPHSRANRLSEEFRRSGVYGIVGVFVVAGLCIVIALSAGNNPDPKLQYGLIFGVVALFLVGLFFLQTRDLNRAEGGTRRALGQGPSDVSDPTKMSEPDLWAALAVKPIDRDAMKARGRWGSARRSIHLGMIVCVLIFLTVVPMYLLDTFVTLYIGVPVIILVALYGAIRAVGSGGEIDQGFERAGEAVRPLGLELVQRPDLKWEPRMPPMWGMNARLRGELRMEGKRHGHAVSVVQENNVSVTTVKESVPAFKVKPASELDGIPHSDRWKNVQVRGGPSGVVVQRKGDLGAWLCDLWLAERLASTL